jgi:hypothetical protein
MEGYKKIESIIKLKMLKNRGIYVFIFLFLLNAAGWYTIEPSVLFEIGMLVSFVSLIYLLFDYKGY